MSGNVSRSGWVFGAMALAGAVGMAAGCYLEGARRFWGGWLVGSLFLMTIGLGALFMAALEHLVGARWSVPLRRVSERISGLLILVIPFGILALGSVPVLFPWASDEGLKSPLVAGKAAWLNLPFFAIRTVACLGLWAWSYRILVGGSLRQDESRDPAFTVRARRFAPIFMVIFAFTVTIIAFDWISSLEPEWYSDIFGVYLFAGTFLAGLAATALGCLHLASRGRLPGVGFDHLYNLGGFLFAFTVFWSYIGFAQYMLMWYANLPEEVFWYQDRVKGPWLTVTLALAVLHFIIPFFALVTRDSKGDPRRLRWVASLVLVAHALDLYWLVFPTVGAHVVNGHVERGHAALLFGWPELSCALFFAGAGLLFLSRQFRRGADMVIGDPFLKEGLEFRL